MTRRYKILLEPGEDGFILASCPALKGCRTQGRSRQEALRNLREAMDLYIDALKAHGESVPEDLVEYLEVEIEAA